MPFWNWNRMKENNAAFGSVVTEICQEEGVPDVPFDLNAAVKQVVAGTWPGVPRDGHWWVAGGLEQIGKSDRTRLLVEDQAVGLADAERLVVAWFAPHRGAGQLPPHLPEGRWSGRMKNIHGDILHFRITGRMRPLGGWAVAVPPHVIGSKRR
jgi:hypothetical protein